MRSSLPLLLLVACVPEDEGPTWEPTVGEAWDREDVRPALTHPFFDDHPDVAELSLLAGAVSGPEADRPDAGHRGAFGVGNGRVVALAGLTDPLNTLHGMIGPVYQRRSRFFGDTALRLVVDGETVPFEVEAIARPRGTSLVVTRGDVGGLSLTVVDVAPRPEGVDPFEVPPVIVRFLLVEHDGATAPELAVELDTVDTVAEVDGLLTAENVEEGLVLGYLPDDGAWTQAGEAWRLPLPALGADGTSMTALTLAVAHDQGGLVSLADAVADADLEAWLDDTTAWWTGFSASGVQIASGDPWVDDLVDALRSAVRLQQSAWGGVVPVSRYTSTWLRDSIGPVRFLARLGQFEQAEAAMAYLHACHIRRGDIGNSCESGLLPDAIPPEPDWGLFPPFPERTASEGPSYVPLAWREIVRWTGDGSGVTSRWSYLRRTLLGQTVTDGLQTWSNDETFRLAMEIALGVPIETDWPSTAWSSNSAFVMIPAARFLASQADAAGAPADATLLRDLADDVQMALEDAFLQPEGHFAAVVPMDPAASLPTQPFEDVALKAIWTGAYPPDDPIALGNLRAVLDQLGRGDGTIQSEASSSAALNPLYADGVLTGMLPGFVLWNLSVTGDPLADAAFDQVLSYVSSSGNVQEGQVYADRSALQPVYDPRGVIGDVAARFRPWEGGIVGDALVAHLLGAEPLAGDMPGLRVRPRLPGASEGMSATGLRVRDAVVDLELTRDAGLAVVATNPSDVALSLRVEVPLGVWEDVAVEADGPTGEAEVVSLPQGERMVVFPDVVLMPGDTVRFAVGAAGG